MVAWLLGCLVAWLHGCMVAWLLGCMVAWLHGCMVDWLHGCLVSWLHGLPGCMVAWLLFFYSVGPLSRLLVHPKLRSINSPHILTGMPLVFLFVCSPNCSFAGIS